MRKLATIRTISDIKPIHNADAIEVAVVDGWQCVVKKRENFKIGDKIVYIEVDSVMPPKPEFEFLADKKYRVRTIKLRKQISQGLVLPLSLLSGAKYNVGDDVTKELGITKYDPELQKENKLKPEVKHNVIIKWLLGYKWFRKLYNKNTNNNVRKGNFPDWIVKTDEERVQNLSTLYNTEKANETEFIATEKLDGTSATYFYRNGEFGVCSRNLKLDNEDNVYWRIAKHYDIKSALRLIVSETNSEAVVLQGEIIGEGIQGNKYHRVGQEFYAFNLILNGEKLDYANMMSWLPPRINAVPVVDRFFKLDVDLLDIAYKATGKSLLLDKQEREGIVVRNYKKNISFKIISPLFLLAEDNKEDN